MKEPRGPAQPAWLSASALCHPGARSERPGLCRGSGDRLGDPDQLLRLLATQIPHQRSAGGQRDFWEAWESLNTPRRTVLSLSLGWAQSPRSAWVLMARGAGQGPPSAWQPLSPHILPIPATEEAATTHHLHLLPHSPLVLGPWHTPPDTGHTPHGTHAAARGEEGRCTPARSHSLAGLGEHTGVGRSMQWEGRGKPHWRQPTGLGTDPPPGQGCAPPLSGTPLPAPGAQGTAPWAPEAAPSLPEQYLLPRARTPLLARSPLQSRGAGHHGAAAWLWGSRGVCTEAPHSHRDPRSAD